MLTMQRRPLRTRHAGSSFSEQIHSRRHGASHHLDADPNARTSVNIGLRQFERPSRESQRCHFSGIIAPGTREHLAGPI